MRLRQATATAAVAVLIAACGGADGDPETDTAAPEATDGTPDDAGDDGIDQPDLPDPDELVTDGEFRGQGVVLPVPDGWSIDEMALMQGLIVASSDDDPTQQLAAQAIDATALPDDETIDFDELLELQRTQFQEVDPDLAPTIDEEVEVEGATQAHRLRFEDVSLPEQPAFRLELILAEDGDGRIALFNYAAPSDGFDEDIAELLIDGVAIDPDSEPPAPMVPEEELPDEGAGDDTEPVEPGDDAATEEDDA